MFQLFSHFVCIRQCGHVTLSAILPRFPFSLTLSPCLSPPRLAVAAEGAWGCVRSYGLQPHGGYVDEVVDDGVYCQSGRRVYLQLAGYIAPVCDDGVGRYEEVVGNLLVRHPLCHAYYDILLPVREFLGLF